MTSASAAYDPRQLLDHPPVTADELAGLERRLAALVGDDLDIVIVPSEAILALEAIATSVGAPGRTALNVVTGPYGRILGDWLRRAGTDVVDLDVPFDDVVTVDRIAEALQARPVDIVCVVHAEAATGGTNPIADIAAVVRASGAVSILDAVSAVGAEPVDAAAWGVDVTAIGGQKALAGTPAPSAVAVSERGWAAIDANPRAPRASALSLTDWRAAWLRTDRRTVPGVPSWLDTRALTAALDRYDAEGADAVHRRHRAAAAAAIAGVTALGLEPWQRRPEGRAPIVTTVRLDTGTTGLGDGDLGGIVSAGTGMLRGRLLRINHYGRAASADAVDDAVRRIAAAIGAPAHVALDAAAAAWQSIAQRPPTSGGL